MSSQTVNYMHGFVDLVQPGLPTSVISLSALRDIS
jgi:hypothetical protein